MEIDEVVEARHTVEDFLVALLEKSNETATTKRAAPRALKESSSNILDTVLPYGKRFVTSLR